MHIDELKPIVESVPLFRTLEEKEKFLLVVSALKLRLLSLSKASEIMNMTRTGLLELLEALDIDFSFLTADDAETEKTWPDDSRF
jgi:predicted HTH domain antitoxin